MKRTIGIGAICIGLFLAGGALAADENVALHAKVKVSPHSNYAFTKDRNPDQLTDGIYASTKAGWDAKHKTSSLWVQPGTLGWAHVKPVIITIDLGKVEPISGLIYSTAGGRASVTWPKAIYITTSDDGKTWHAAGELVSLAKEAGTQPPAEGYANFRYITHGLKTHGRYVALGVDEAPMIFVDEVEVLRGPDALLKESAGPVVPPMPQYFAGATVTQKAKHRLNADIDSIRQLLKASGLPPATAAQLNQQLDKAAGATADLPMLPADLKTILPLNDLHAEILAVHGEALAARGFQPLTAWKVHRYAFRPLVEIPDRTRAATIDLSMLKNQFRSDSFLLTNATGKAMTARVRLDDAPAGTEAGWLDLKSAIWTDTLINQPVQDALMPMEQSDGAWTLTIPAGLSGKVWVTVDSSKLPPGDFSGKFLIDGGGENLAVPFKLHVSSLAMPMPRLSLTMWDYTNRDKMYAITKENRSAAIAMMQSHFVDSPWAVWILPTPKEGDFNAANELTNKMDLSPLDQWVKSWPGARNYFVFYSIKGKDSFAGAKMGTPRFNARVGNWIKAIEAHWKSLGLKPSQLVLCLLDESHTDEDDLHIVQWGQAIKAAAPEVRLFSDPIWPDPSQSEYPRAFLIPDILCPHPNWASEFFENLRKEHGKTIWLYNGPGLNHAGDAQLAYRQMAWRVFAADGMGEGFWAFGDTSGARTSWQAYTAARLMYAPCYIDEHNVYDSIHWDATREGVEDFEELSMLKDAVARSADATWQADARKVLDQAVKAVNADTAGNPEYLWSKGTDPRIVDAELAKVRRMLEQAK